MTDRYWSCSKGAQLPKDVVETTTSTAGATVELRVTFTSFASKLNALIALEAIRSKIDQDPWPPA